MCDWCVSVPATKLSLAPSARFLFLLTAVTNLRAFNYLYPLPTPKQLFRPRVLPAPLPHPRSFSGIPHPWILTHQHRLLPVSCTLTPSLTSDFIALYSRLQTVPGPNAFTLCLPVPSNLNILERRLRFRDYPEKSLCYFLKFGWPVGYTSFNLSAQSPRNHGPVQSPHYDA